MQEYFNNLHASIWIHEFSIDCSIRVILTNNEVILKEYLTPLLEYINLILSGRPDIGGLDNESRLHCILST